MIKWGKESWRVKRFHIQPIIQTRPRKVEAQESRKNSYSTWANTLFSLLEISLRAQTYFRNKWQRRLRLCPQAILEIQWKFLDVWLKWITTNHEMKKSKPLPSPNVMDWGRIGMELDRLDCTERAVVRPDWPDFWYSGQKQCYSKQYQYFLSHSIT